MCGPEDACSQGFCVPGDTWVRTSDPSSGFDLPTAIAVDRDGLYVVGHNNVPGEHDSEWRIEKRRRSDGELLWVRTPNPSGDDDKASDVAVDDGGLYVVGGHELGDGWFSAPSQWRIEKRSPDDGELIWWRTSDPSEGRDWPTAVALDEAALYVVGGAGTAPWTLTDSGARWRIEKRDVADGELIWADEVDPVAGGADCPTDVAVDATGVYVLGMANEGLLAESGPLAFVEKRRRSDGHTVWVRPVGSAWTRSYAIGLDATGLVLVGSHTGPEDSTVVPYVEKRDHDSGHLLWAWAGDPLEGQGGANAVAVAADFLYVAGWERLGEDLSSWRLEKRSLETGDLAAVWTAPLGWAGQGDNVSGVAVFDGWVYVVGGHRPAGATNSEWRIMRLEL